ncbi:hypothetical protein [Streptomyces sp. NPDC004330]|uniref:hypothetical protein n=1 Tax=Streptomyces sp. NPDC004330 TaxID=3364700 RepID=UPI0036783653
MMRTAGLLLLALTAAACAPGGGARTAPPSVPAVPLASPGFPPTAARARTLLAGLRVARGENGQTYERAKFGDGWSDETDAPGGRNGCDTRDDLDVLLATDKQTNQDKSSRTPDTWRPPRSAYGCEYGRRWTGIKAKYGLAVSAPEKKAVEELLAGCG